MSSSTLSSRLSCPFALAQEWLAQGRAVAFATVVGTGGRSPRPLGSIMVMDDSGRVEGSVSGGCVEADVMSIAREVMAGASPCVRSYGGEEVGLWSVGLACGGRLDVFVEAVRSPLSPEGTFPAALLPWIIDRRTKGQSLAIGMALDGSRHVLLDGRGMPVCPDGEIPPAITEIMTARVTSGEAGAVSPALTPDWFVQLLAPAPRLLIVGAVHIAQVLAAMAMSAGYNVIIIDPRTSLATPDRFPGVRLVDDWPDDALAAAGPDRMTAIVTLTHDSKLDDPALVEALKGPAFYIGALGSRGTHASRLARLREAGVEEEALRRIRGPVGLPIGAVDVEEIAISIMADIVAVRRAAPLSMGISWWSPRKVKA
ncbi:MAG: XdhC/CoxI family protein [Acetobacter aceti]|uniref:Xanthine dehydrogenase n=1 Tax=Acetobacter aceti TaxID=435 RepID=A0A1U9KF47_ACEAC|nr:XdhC/CoxI family protein [Acetobacter aceti]AQS84425.1 xanthine dehydrogenase [Acetobacter aceti]